VSTTTASSTRWVAGTYRGVKFTILGQLWSMKNRRFPIRKRSLKTGKIRTIMIPDAMARKFELDFITQVPAEYRNLKMGGLDTPLKATITVYYPSRRQDLDCALVYDLLQKSGVVANDRYIIEHHEFAEVDAKNPRVEVTIEEL